MCWLRIARTSASASFSASVCSVDTFGASFGVGITGVSGGFGSWESCPCFLGYLVVCHRLLLHSLVQ